MHGNFTFYIFITFLSFQLFFKTAFKTTDSFFIFHKEGICPTVPEVPDTNCTQECAKDTDCIGDRKCCKLDCSKKCTMPVRTRPKRDVQGMIKGRPWWYYDCQSPPMIAAPSFGCDYTFDLDDDGCIKSYRPKCYHERLRCGANEEWVECGVCYERHCGQYYYIYDYYYYRWWPSRPSILSCGTCRPRCQCKSGYIRDWYGICIRQSDCPKIEVDRCKMPADPGYCDENNEQWYYNHYAKICQKFTWGGCGGNSNRFSSLESCINSCGVEFDQKTNPNPRQCPPRQSGGVDTCMHECDGDSDCDSGSFCCENWCGKRCYEPQPKTNL